MMDIQVYTGNLGPGRKIMSGELYKILVEEGMNVKFADASDYLPSSLVNHSEKTFPHQLDSLD